MILDLRPLLRGETNIINIDYLLTPEPLDGVVFDSDVHVSGNITDPEIMFSDKLSKHVAREFKKIAPVYRFYLKAEALASNI